MTDLLSTENKSAPVAGLLLVVVLWLVRRPLLTLVIFILRLAFTLVKPSLFAIATAKIWQVVQDKIALPSQEAAVAGGANDKGTVL